MDSQTVKLVSESFIKPKFNLSNRKQPYYLAPGDLAMLSANYIQKGLLFAKPTSSDQSFDVNVFLETLKNSLALTLVHFYPLAGQFVTEIDHDKHTSLIFIDCDKGLGAKFIYCTLEMTVSDILSPIDVPSVVKFLFDHHKAVNHDGHIRPLLSVQVTELNDGIFIGCSMNHSVADGTSYWHFWNVWSEIHRQTQNATFSNPPDDMANRSLGLGPFQTGSFLPGPAPIHERWLPKGHGPKIFLPFTNPEEFVSRYESPHLREQIFHFSSEIILMLKKRANLEIENTEKEGKVSSLQALTAFIWRCITRARRLEGDQKTDCTLDANIRQRLEPRLPEGYFGNAIWVTKASVTAEKLLQNDLGWTSLILSQSVSELTDKNVRLVFDAWMQRPVIFQTGAFFNANSVVIGSSPRFDIYGNEFGVGKPVSVRSGYAHKFPGKVTVYPGRKGGGSMDLEMCLTPETMAALEKDDEFMAVITCC